MIFGLFVSLLALTGGMRLVELAVSVRRMRARPQDVVAEPALFPAMAALHTAPYPGGILIDQGLADKFLSEQLHPQLFEAACAQAGQPLQLRRHAGYDHGYYFIATFMADHLNHHARQFSQ